MHLKKQGSEHSLKRSFVESLRQAESEVKVAGWVYHLRVLAKTTFVVLKDCTGVIQCVMPTNLDSNLGNLSLRLDDCIEVEGILKSEARSKSGFELHIRRIRRLNETTTVFPFNSSSEIEPISRGLRGFAA